MTTWLQKDYMTTKWLHDYKMTRWLQNDNLTKRWLPDYRQLARVYQDFEGLGILTMGHDYMTTHNDYIMTTKWLVDYKMSAWLQNDYLTTKWIHDYKMTKWLQNDYETTKWLHDYKMTTLIHDNKMTWQ